MENPNLAIGVFTGIILTKISRVYAESAVEGNKRIYVIQGELFFASVTELLPKFNYEEDGIEEVEINLSHSHIWDDSVFIAVQKIVTRFRESGKQVAVKGMNEANTELVGKLRNKLGPH
ncbi:STAS domain-containing protein [Oceanobacillus saliphilus]|uniref:STAS domain-containing protein n=1 Tax=Oceanobacillus saliphilus TaxID=2925834 RepID=UPI00201DAD73|nr:STAS domain-containing protein [Oceanobacillus saliphilus]